MNRIVELRKKIWKLRGALKNVEWIHHTGIQGVGCPSCGANRNYGEDHKPECRLRRALDETSEFAAPIPSQVRSVSPEMN